MTKFETKTKFEFLKPPCDFEFRVSAFEFNYMIYMSYMVNKAAVPSAFSLQPSACF